MKNKFLYWLQKKLGIVELSEAVYNIHKLIGERTTVHCDVHYKHASEVIVIGTYHNKDYVRCFHLQHDDLKSLIEELKQREKFANVGKFDMIGTMPFSAVYDRKTF